MLPRPAPRPLQGGAETVEVGVALQQPHRPLSTAARRSPVNADEPGRSKRWWSAATWPARYGVERGGRAVPPGGYLGPVGDLDADSTPLTQLTG